MEKTKRNDLRSIDDMKPADRSADDCAPAHLSAQTHFTREQVPDYQAEQRAAEATDPGTPKRKKRALQDDTE